MDEVGVLSTQNTTLLSSSSFVGARGLGGRQGRSGRQSRSGSFSQERTSTTGSNRPLGEVGGNGVEKEEVGKIGKTRFVSCLVVVLDVTSTASACVCVCLCVWMDGSAQKSPNRS